MSEALLDTELTEEQRVYARQIVSSSEQTLAIINDILDVSKIEAGHLELDVTDFDLHQTIRDACLGAGPHATSDDTRLDLQISDAVPPHARGDGRRLSQVLLNLITNAVKFTPAGTITVRVDATPASAGGYVIRAEVADTGIGIDPGVLQRMFEPFTQADTSTTRLYGGSGLGLSIVRELVALMGGTIRAESEPGRGSTFSFEVPLEAARVSGPRPSRGGQAVARSALWATPPLVLVVEDTPINQIVASRGLERCGCRSDVLMDCQMPILDGYQTTIELRRREAPGEHTPVIAMTAHAMDGDRQQCLDAGMDDYITKPMRHGELAAVLARWIPSNVDSPVAPIVPASAA
jgi:CheY-like chemotaxis protein